MRAWLRILFLVACAASATEIRDKTSTTTAAAPEPPRTTTAKTVESDQDVSILKQINKVNDDGSYTFGYEASDGSFKVETRDVAGNVKGMFGFVDETGQLKRVSYSASNSTGFRTAAAGSTSSSPPSDSAAIVVATTTTPSSSVQTIPSRKPADDDHDPAEPTDGKSTTGVKKVLVSKRLVPQRRDDETTGRRYESNDLRRRQLSSNDDSPDVYGAAARDLTVSPVVSALMSELDPTVKTSYEPEQPYVRQDDQRPTTTIDRRTQRGDTDDDNEPPQYRPVAIQYRQRAAYPPALPPVVYGPDLTALRDELTELILYFVRARVSQITAVAPYDDDHYHHHPYYHNRPPPPQPQPYPMPYQQPNYYVPSYYQGPRMPGPSTGVVVQQQRDDGYATVPSQSSPRVTQTLKNGLIRMLLSTSPRYGSPDEPSAPPARLAYRRTTTQSAPVRNVQIINDDADDRPVTTESPD